MIFYFTGTGNSLFAAKKLLGEGEKLISIADAIKNNQFEYEISEGEKVGFVFPVYFYTVPDIVKSFVSNLTLHGADYVWSVVTCGGSIGQTGAVLKKLLKKRGLTLSHVTPLLMPDNGMLFYQIPTEEEQNSRLTDAEKRLEETARDTGMRKMSEIGSLTIGSDLFGLGFKVSNKTAEFYADEKCVCCGLCEEICPLGAIRIENNKPKWVTEKCSKCSACINRCPQKAIQYGGATKNRNRYVNPVFKKEC